MPTFAPLQINVCKTRDRGWVHINEVKQFFSIVTATEGNS